MKLSQEPLGTAPLKVRHHALAFKRGCREAFWDEFMKLAMSAIAASVVFLKFAINVIARPDEGGPWQSG